ncbi:hypothetical protein CASFOL_029004 [Castilleja foliolosa]|uniref:Uncharacterized protein n=1 Tax=Castilleja foliolosa TaxID=1961234 RepID=A0ABD3CF41_9LAMI
MNFVLEIFCFLSSDSLSSTIITLYTLMLIYFPSFFLQFIFSPVIFSTLILLLYLLRLGADQKPAPEKNEPDDPTDNIHSAQIDEIRDQKLVSPASDSGGFKPDPSPIYADSFVEWDLRAPLEVIHEEYEGEEADGNDVVSGVKRESEVNIIQRYASLSLFYPESDGDDSSEGESPDYGDWDSPGNMCFRWEGEDDREGLIEIALDEKRNCEVDEENLIEIDLFPAT